LAIGIKMRAVSALFNGHVKLTDIVLPQRYKLNFAAQGGLAGFGKGESAIEIKPLEKGCELHYMVHSSVGGKIAQLGQRLIDEVSKNRPKTFCKRFEVELEKLYPAAQEPSVIEVAPGSKQSGGGRHGRTLRGSSQT
jgi:carbon monoxide dehydrogenase subunit G